MSRRFWRSFPGAEPVISVGRGGAEGHDQGTEGGLMRWTKCVLWPLFAGILCGLPTGAQELTRRAQIVWPLLGGPLYYRGTIEVSLEGLAQSEFESLWVRVEALPVSGGDPVGPICLWEGWSEVPVVSGSAGDGCAWIAWTDPQGGRALLRVLWNYFPPGFRAGDYLVRVELLVRPPGGWVSRWGYTDWHRIRLIPEEGPALTVVVNRPAPLTEFGVGEPVMVVGVAANPVLPIRVRLDVRRGDVGERWDTVAQRTLNTVNFEIVWDAPQGYVGIYYIRVALVDGRGASATSAEVPILLVHRPLQVRLTHPEARAEVAVGEVLPVRGQVLGGTLPGRVSLEIKRDHDSDRWDSVSEVPLVSSTFEFRWETGGLTPGVWSLRATVRDSLGLSASSSELRVTVREKRFQILVAGKSADAFEPLRERDPVQFELDAEGTWTKVEWAFGDGNTSDRRSPLHVYEKAGTYKVCVTAHGPSGSSSTACADVVVVPRQTVVATRRILGYPRPTCDGVGALVYLSSDDRAPSAQTYPAKVEVVIRVVEPVAGILLTERIPAGWSAEGVQQPLDAIRVQFVRRGQEVSWIITSVGHQFVLNPGTEIVVSYLLVPPVGAGIGFVDIEGEVYAQLGPDSTARRKVAGPSRVMLERKLDPLVALLYLRKEPDGTYALNPPYVNPGFVLTSEQLKIAEELILGEKPVPFADVVLKPEDYLRLLAYFQAERPVFDCLVK